MYTYTAYDDKIYVSMYMYCVCVCVCNIQNCMYIYDDKTCVSVYVYCVGMCVCDMSLRHTHTHTHSSLCVLHIYIITGHFAPACGIQWAPFDSFLFSCFLFLSFFLPARSHTLQDNSLRHTHTHILSHLSVCYVCKCNIHITYIYIVYMIYIYNSVCSLSLTHTYSLIFVCFIYMYIYDILYIKHVFLITGHITPACAIQWVPLVPLDLFLFSCFLFLISFWPLLAHIYYMTYCSDTHTHKPPHL